MSGGPQRVPEEADVARSARAAAPPASAGLSPVPQAFFAPAAAGRAAGPAGQRRSRRLRWGTLAVHAVLIAVCALVILPLLWMALTAFKSHDQVFTHSPWWIPPSSHLGENIRQVFSRVPLGRYFLNSLAVSTAITLLDLFFSTLAGYALAKYRFRGRDAIFGAIVATMMVPFIVILIPQYIIVRDLGWLDTYAALILPFAVSSFGIFMMRQAFADTPDELIDAARIDGAGEWRILFRIVVPLHVPALVSLAILRFLSEWDSLLWPLVATNSEGMRTLSLGLALLQDDRYGTDMPQLMTAATLAVLPIILVYAFLQRYFIKSAAGAGLKQ
ncbi:carbohydrate ABC transporter permease [Roseomonas sp. BN140053]|uniref:carbohydrate ABC transporter permease n=1 Tax=Roseomonas sp. BN140053 TaxID=3391898 RepID=UPI0039ED771E